MTHEVCAMDSSPTQSSHDATIDVQKYCLKPTGSATPGSWSAGLPSVHGAGLDVSPGAVKDDQRSAHPEKDSYGVDNLAYGMLPATPNTESKAWKESEHPDVNRSSQVQPPPYHANNVYSISTPPPPYAAQSNQPGNTAQKIQQAYTAQKTQQSYTAQKNQQAYTAQKNQQSYTAQKNQQSYTGQTVQQPFTAQTKQHTTHHPYSPHNIPHSYSPQSPQSLQQPYSPQYTRHLYNQQGLPQQVLNSPQQPYSAQNTPQQYSTQNIPQPCSPQTIRRSYSPQTTRQPYSPKSRRHAYSPQCTHTQLPYTIQSIPSPQKPYNSKGLNTPYQPNSHTGRLIQPQRIDQTSYQGPYGQITGDVLPCDVICSQAISDIAHLGTLSQAISDITPQEGRFRQNNTSQCGPFRQTGGTDLGQPVSGHILTPDWPSSASSSSSDLAVISPDLRFTRESHRHKGGSSRRLHPVQCPTPPQPSTTDPEHNHRKDPECTNSTEQLAATENHQHSHNSPKRVVASPHRDLTSPHRDLASPHRDLTSPHRDLTSPHRVQTSPQRVLTSPQRALTPPQHAAVSPQHALFSHNGCVVVSDSSPVFTSNPVQGADLDSPGHIVSSWSPSHTPFCYPSPHHTPHTLTIVHHPPPPPPAPPDKPRNTAATATKTLKERFQTWKKRHKKTSTKTKTSRHSVAEIRYDSLRQIDRSDAPIEEDLKNAPWYQAGIPREIALEMLTQEEIGSFVVRDSTTHPGCYALSVKVPKFDNPSGISHYLIMRSGHGGVKLKGLDKEWSSLTALVTHHSVMRELLPCPLRLPRAANNPAFHDDDDKHADQEEDEDYQRLADCSHMMDDLKM